MEAAAYASLIIKLIRWTARISSALFIALWLLIVIGESLEGQHRPDSPPLTARAIVELSIMGLSLLGLLLAWKWELAGGIVALAAYALGGIVFHAMHGMYPVAIVAILFLTCWWMSRPHLSSVSSETSKSK